MRLKPTVLRSLVALPLVAFASCAAAPSPQHDQALAVVWMQRAAEYRAACAQAYRAAEDALPRAIADAMWTACLEQKDDAKLADKQLAVVVDVDETMLDNSGFAARQIRDGKGFDPVAWASWVAERRATAIPGALEYARTAEKLSVRVVYVTNRRVDSGDASAPSSEESDTRANLRALGFPIDERDGFDVVLTKGERGSGSDKASRRALVAERFRVVQLVGDNLGDFAADTDPKKEADPERYAANCRATEERRAAIVAERAAWWGSRWILVPNPSYGGFESCVIGQHGSLHAGLRTSQP